MKRLNTRCPPLSASKASKVEDVGDACFISPRWGFRSDFGDHGSKLAGDLDMFQAVTSHDIDIFKAFVVNAFNEVHALAVFSEIEV